MKKSEALNVMHEILLSCKESIVMNSISLDDNSNRLTIVIKTVLDSVSRLCIDRVLDHNNLSMKEQKDYITIYKP